MTKANLARLVEVRNVPADRLRAAVGSHADWLQQLARGIDPRRVEPNRERKSAGSVTTFAEDLTDREEIRREWA